MVGTPLKIDLNEFKLHIYLNPDTGLTLHFDTPSRKFYLAVIALVINEMKKKNSITSIPLHHHLDELVLLNKTIGKEAGSSKEELLLNRIYRKWKDALPDLEDKVRGFLFLNILLTIKLENYIYSIKTDPFNKSLPYRI